MDTTIMNIEYAGAHYFRGELGDRCEYPDCGARVGCSSHVANQPRIDAAHAAALTEQAYRRCQVFGMGKR